MGTTMNLCKFFSAGVKWVNQIHPSNYLAVNEDVVKEFNALGRQTEAYLKTLSTPTPTQDAIAITAKTLGGDVKDELENTVKCSRDDFDKAYGIFSIIGCYATQAPDNDQIQTLHLRSEALYDLIKPKTPSQPSFRPK